MTLLITLEVRVPDDVPPTQVIDELVSNVESCNWEVLHTYYEVIDREGDAQ